MGLLPYGSPNNRLRSTIVTVNKALSRLADNRTTFFLDAGPSLTNPATRSTASDFQADLGHPNAAGYQALADDMIGLLVQMTGLIPNTLA